MVGGRGGGSVSKHVTHAHKDAFASVVQFDSRHFSAPLVLACDNAMGVDDVQAFGSLDALQCRSPTFDPSPPAHTRTPPTSQVVVRHGRFEGWQMPWFPAAAAAVASTLVPAAVAASGGWLRSSSSCSCLSALHDNELFSVLSLCDVFPFDSLPNDYLTSANSKGEESGSRQPYQRAPPTPNPDATKRASGLRRVSFDDLAGLTLAATRQHKCVVSLFH